MGITLDASLTIWNGKSLTGSLLQIIDCDTMQFENTQLGGYGQGSFNCPYPIASGYAWESNGTNINAPNRTEAYLRNDTCAATINSGVTSILVNYASRFKTGQTILIYDGTNHTFATINSIVGSYLNLNTTVTSTYAVGTAIMVKRYQGYISAVNLDADVTKNSIAFETSGYQTELATTIATTKGGGWECGYWLYQLLNSYASQLDITFSQSNFTMSTTSNPASGGTYQPYYGQQTQTDLFSIIQDVLTYANANTNQINYTFWVDELGAAHFGPINTTTPSATANLVTPTPNFRLDGIMNIVDQHQTRDQDMQNVANVVIVSGGQDGNGNTITAIVEDQNSINLYGQIETTLSNTGITTTAAASAFGFSYLQQYAYPRQSSNTDFVTTGNFVTAQDYVSIQGFSNGTTQQMNLSSVTTTWSAGAQQFKQQLKGQQTFPNINQIMKQIANQKYLAALPPNGNDGSGTHNRFVSSGVVPSYSGATFNVTAGVLGLIINPNGLQNKNTTSLSQSTPADGHYTLAWLYANADGTAYSSPQWIWISDTSKTVTFTNVQNGTGVSSGPSYLPSQYLPLFDVFRLNNLIVTYTDLRTFGGVGQTSLAQMPSSIQVAGPNITAAAHGTIQGLTVTGAASGTTVDLPIAVTFGDWTTSTVPQWFSGVQVFARIHGTTNTSESGPVYYLGSSVTLNGSIHNLGTGVTWDIGFSYVDHAGFLSNANFPSGLSNIVIPGLYGVDAAPNLIVDSNFDYVNWSSGANDNVHAATASYWVLSTPGLTPGLTTTAGYGRGQAYSGTGAAKLVENIVYAKSGASGKNITWTSKYNISVIAGNPTMTISVFIDATYCTGGNLTYIKVVDQSNNLLAIANQTDGAAGRIPVTFGVNTGVTGVAVVIGTGSATINSAGQFSAAIPKLEYSTSMGSYLAGPSKTSSGVTEHTSASLEVQSIINTTAVAGVGSLTFPVSSNILNNLPLVSHDVGIQQRHTLLGACLGVGPYVYVGTELLFPTAIQFVRGNGLTTAGGTTCKVTATTTVPISGYSGVFLPWASGATGITATPICIPIANTGSAGTGFNATCQSPNYELIGLIPGTISGTSTAGFAPTFVSVPTVESLADYSGSGSPVTGQALIYNGSQWTNSTAFASGLEIAFTGTPTTLFQQSFTVSGVNGLGLALSNGSTYLMNIDTSGNVGIPGTLHAATSMYGASAVIGSTLSAVGITDTGTTTLASINLGTGSTVQNIIQSGTAIHMGPLGTNTGPIDIYANGQSNGATAIFSANGNLAILGEFIGSGAGLTAGTVPNNALVTTPLDTSSTAQTKSGALTVTNLTDSGSTNINGGSLTLGNGTSNFLFFNNTGVAAPTYTTRSVGTKVVWYQSLSGTSTDFATGISSGTLWNSVASGCGYAWYVGTTAVATLSYGGTLSLNNFYATANCGAGGTFYATGITDQGTSTLSSINLNTSGTIQNIQQSGTAIHMGPLGTNTGPIDIFANGQGNGATAIFMTNGTLSVSNSFQAGSSIYGPTSASVNGGLTANSLTLSTTPLAVTSGGTGGAIGPGSALTSASAAINTTDTILVTNALGTASLAAGSTFAIKLQGTCTSTASASSTFTVRFGTTGTTSDATIATYTLPSASTGTAIPFDAEIMLTIRTIGSGTSATCYGMLRLTNNGSNGGIVTTGANVATPTASGFNSSISSGILSVSYKTSASTTTSTFQTGIIFDLHY